MWIPIYILHGNDIQKRENNHMKSMYSVPNLLHEVWVSLLKVYYEQKIYYPHGGYTGNREDIY
jgi:hypothetical protein